MQATMYRPSSGPRTLEIIYVPTTGHPCPELDTRSATEWFTELVKRTPYAARGGKWEYRLEHGDNMIAGKHEASKPHVSLEAMRAPNCLVMKIPSSFVGFRGNATNLMIRCLLFPPTTYLQVGLAAIHADLEGAIRELNEAVVTGLGLPKPPAPPRDEVTEEAIISDIKLVLLECRDTSCYMLRDDIAKALREQCGLKVPDDRVYGILNTMAQIGELECDKPTGQIYHYRYLVDGPKPPVCRGDHDEEIAREIWNLLDIAEYRRLPLAQLGSKLDMRPGTIGQAADRMANLGIFERNEEGCYRRGSKSSFYHNKGAYIRNPKLVDLTVAPKSDDPKPPAPPLPPVPPLPPDPVRPAPEPPLPPAPPVDARAITLTYLKELADRRETALRSGGQELHDAYRQMVEGMRKFGATEEAIAGVEAACQTALTELEGKQSSAKNEITMIRNVAALVEAEASPAPTT